MRDFETPTRSAAYAANAMAATSHPFATRIAVETLRKGGNAADAAVAAVAALGVVEPQMTGIGGDCFALYWPKDGELIAYNGSGRAPAAAEIGWYRDNGIDAIPAVSPHAVTVPGAVEAWHRLVTDHGRLAFGDLMRPAIDLAENGCPVQPRVARDWALQAEKLARTPAAARIFLPNGRAPSEGDIHANPELAATLRRIAADGPEAFYTGAVAEDMVETLRGFGGLHTLDDFAACKGDYVTPIRTAYRGYDVYECPPNGQGLIALMMLNICAGFDFSDMGPMDARRLHIVAEAGRLAFRDRDAVLGDPRTMPVSVDALLSDDYAARLRAAIDPERAMDSPPPLSLPPGSDTTYLCVVDADGNAVSLINSLFNGFGSGLVAEKSGVIFHNRGMSFRIDETHPNGIAPGKRPMHTIIPAMLGKDGRAVMPFGVMGGHYQPFGHTHVVGNILDFGMDPQAAIDCPRVFHFGGVLAAESGVPAPALEKLALMGHRVAPAGGPLGGGQAIRIDHERGVLTGGSDPRKDGCALGY